MNSLLLLAAMAQFPVGDGVVIFGREPWYRAVRGDQETFTGVLQRIPGAALDSRCTFCLVTAIEGKNTTRDVFVAGQNQALANFAGQRVRITGMTVDLKVDGRMRYEIWPARLEGAGGGPGDPVVVGNPILASTEYNLPAGTATGIVRPGGFVRLPVRSPEMLLRVCVSPQNAAELLGRLGTQGRPFDWNRFMLVVCSNGLQTSTGCSIQIVGVDQVGQGWRVRWRWHTPALGQGLVRSVHPSKVIVLPRLDGPVTFEQVGR
jgi:hypothetical protein